MLLILALFWHVIIPGKENQLEKFGYRTESDNKGCGLSTDRKNSFTELE